jgi:hypothetical protein
MRPPLMRTDMKAVCNDCKFEISGEKREELDDKYRPHSMTFGHESYFIFDYD